MPKRPQYASTKHDMEVSSAEFHDADGPMTLACLRFFNVYGPRQDPHSDYSGVISKFLACGATGEQLPILGDGSFTRDFVFVKDIAQGVCRVLFAAAGSDVTKTHRIFNCGTQTRVSILELAETIIKLADSGSTVLHKAPRDGDVPHSQSDTAAIREQFGFSPAFTLEQGMEKTLDWFKSTL